MRPAIPSITLVSDDPSAVETDAFSHGAYAEALASLVVSAEGRSPTIGLFGPWGSGKSDTLLRLQKKLPTDTRFVLFDAWRYEGDGLREQFLRVVTQALPARTNKAKRRRRRVLERIEVDVQRTNTKLEFSWTTMLHAAASAGVAFLATASVFWLTPLADALTTERALPVAALVGAFTGLLTVTQQAIRAVPITRTRKRAAEAGEFEAIWSRLLEELGGSRLVVAIDNLDRCSGPRALEVLSLIKGFLEQDRPERGPAVAFIVAVDDKAIMAHVEHAIGTVAPFVEAAEYLRKLFTGVVRLDPPNDFDRRAFLTNTVRSARAGLPLDDDELDTLVQLAAVALGSTPRRSIQFINNLQLKYAVRRAARSATQPESRGLEICRLALLEEVWPDWHALLRLEPHRLREWDSAAVNGHRPERGLDAGWETLSVFLQASADIAIDDPRPLLSFKPAPHEELPEYNAFRSALLSGSAGLLEELIPSTGGETVRELVWTIFSEELRAHHSRGASVAIETACAVPDMAPPDLVGRMLNEAFADRNFRPLLQNLSVRVLEAGLRDPSRRRDEQLIELLRSHLRGDDPIRATQAAEALSVEMRASGRVREKVREDLVGTPALGRNMGVLAALVSDPEFVEATTAGVLATCFHEEPGLFSSRSDALSDVLASIRAHARDTAVHSGMVAACRNSMVGERTTLPRLATIQHVVLAFDDSAPKEQLALLQEVLNNASKFGSTDVLKWVDEQAHLHSDPAGGNGTTTAVVRTNVLLRYLEEGTALDWLRDCGATPADAETRDLWLRMLYRELIETEESSRVGDVVRVITSLGLVASRKTFEACAEELASAGLTHRFAKLLTTVDADIASHSQLPILARLGHSEISVDETTDWSELLASTGRPTERALKTAEDVLRLLRERADKSFAEEEWSLALPMVVIATWLSSSEDSFVQSRSLRPTVTQVLQWWGPMSADYNLASELVSRILALADVLNVNDRYSLWQPLFERGAVLPGEPAVRDRFLQLAHDVLAATPPEQAQALARFIRSQVANSEDATARTQTLRALRTLPISSSEIDEFT